MSRRIKQTKFKGAKKKDPNLSDKLYYKAWSYVRRNPGLTFNAKQLSRKINITGKKRVAALLDALLKMEIEEKVTQATPGVFMLAEKDTTAVVGVVDYVNSKFAFIVSDDLEDDLKIKTEDMKHALNGDTVRVSVSGSGKNGVVLEILEKGKREYVGQIDIMKNFSFVVADSKRMPFDIFIPPHNLHKAFNGDKVIVKITSWRDNDKNPTGEIIKVLGEAGKHDVEMHAILAEYDLPAEFDNQIEKEAATISDKITQSEIEKRRDFRDVTTFTIDPEDAKDFDDAISFKKIGEDKYEIGVHIADVTHYVKEGSRLEDEAYKRATSVYLVDRVVPMLPEKLSNGLCSLRPKEEKLTFSAVFEMNSNGKVSKSWFGRTVIYSDHRFTYESAQEVIEANEGLYAEELMILNNTAKKLRKERFKKGAIGFETQEVKFKLAEDGTPIEIIPKIRFDAHKLVEEYMLLANKKVAENVFKMKEGKNPKTMVYRIHENPKPDRLTVLSDFAGNFGYKVNVEEESINLAKSLNKLLDDIEGSPEEQVLQQLAIRSMSKARYTTDPQGHFGLAFQHYTHFTSPIRRYPDMMVHRLLAHYLDGGKSMPDKEWNNKCIHSSEREKVAADAERSSIKYKQVEYASTLKGQQFEGVVSGVTEWGVFVEMISNKCEGMVRIADIDGDYYDYDEKNVRIIGRRTRNVIRLGDTVTVEVKHTDIKNRTIDLLLIQDK